MSGIPFLLPDTWYARGPSGPGLRHIWASASQRLNLAADIAHGGRSELASQNTVLGRIHKPEKDMVGMKATPAGLSQWQGLIDKSHNGSDLYTKRMMGFGPEIALVGIWAGLCKVYYDYDIKRQNEMKIFIRDVFGNFVSKFDQRMDQLDQRMDRLGQRMDRLDQRMDQLDQRMDRLDQRLGNFESMMDRRMDEIIAILKVKKG